MNEITSFNSFDEAKQGELQQWEFPNERKAKQFLKDIENSAVATGDLMQKNKKQVIIEILPGSPKVTDDAIAKYSKKNGGKRFNQGRSGPWSKTKRVGESVEVVDEVYYKPGERIKYLHKQWNYAMKQIEHSVKVMEKEYSRPSPDWDKIHQEMYNIKAYHLQNIQDFIPQKGYKGPLQGSPVDIVDSVQEPVKSVEISEGKMKEFFMDIHDELEKAMDKKWYREMQSSNGAQGLDNIISNTHKQLYNSGDPDPKDIADAILSKYGRNHKEYMKLSMEMMRRNESVELDEGVDSVEEGRDEEYEKFFKSALKKFGVSSPAELEDDKKKEFFNYVDKNWKGEKKESVMNSYVTFLSKDRTTQPNKAARLSLDARQKNV